MFIPGVHGGQKKESDPGNWSEPSSECFPARATSAFNCLAIAQAPPLTFESICQNRHPWVISMSQLVII